MGCFIRFKKEKEKNAHDVNKYKRFENEFSFKNIQFPVRVSNIPKFEEMNNVSVNLFGINEDDIIIPLYITHRKVESHVDLLLLTAAGISHYIWINKLSRLLHAQEVLDNNKR